VIVKEKKHIASCSFGKDSLASIIVGLENNEPIDGAYYCEVMFNRWISAEVPEHRDFIYDTAIPFLESAGIKVDVVRGKRTFVDLFQHKIEGDGDWAGCIWAWPLCGRCYVQRDCKTRPLESYKKQQWQGADVVQYIGYASDEQVRLAKLDGTKKVSLLDKYGIDEEEATRICDSYGLLSPIYEFAPRNGCWFCPTAKDPELLHLRKYHPHLFEDLMKLQALPCKATEKFNRDMTLYEINQHLLLIEKGLYQRGRT